ncbi:MAG TPA: hypothetical protein VFZ40_00785 [Pyrinomonadaceae bacterium]
MKSTLCLIALTLALGSGVAAQSPATATEPSVAIVKYSWSKERIAWEGDPFAGAFESFEDVRRRAVDSRRLERARGSGNAIEVARVEREMRAEQVIKARPPKPPRYAFVYKVGIKNESDKTITEFDWDYVFFDAATGVEVGRRQFTGVEKIGPGKSKELTFQVSSPPAKTISVYALDKNERRGLSEAVVLVRVAYADGSVWLRN